MSGATARSWYVERKKGKEEEEEEMKSNWRGGTEKRGW
jgi:hypothetical protein